MQPKRHPGLVNINVIPAASRDPFYAHIIDSSGHLAAKGDDSFRNIAARRDGSGSGSLEQHRRAADTSRRRGTILLEMLSGRYGLPRLQRAESSIDSDHLSGHPVVVRI